MRFGIFKFFISPIFLLAVLLAGIGLVNLYSATSSFETVELSQYFTNQFAYTFVGLFCMFIVAVIPVRHIYALGPYIYIGSLLLLILVLVLGSESKGATSWLNLGFVRLQPSEFGKIGLVVMLSRYLSNLDLERPLGLTDLGWPLVLFLIPTVLVILQNDLGSSLFYGFIFGSLLMVQGVQFRLILIALVIVVALSIVSYNFMLKPYQKDRIVSFLEPERDARGSGYHLVQSKIAVGSGGMFGKGYGKGQSHKLKFLPERHTDFIFPVLSEEWGFAGGAVVISLYLLFLLSGVGVAFDSQTRFGFFLAMGVVAFYFWHLVINLGGVLGLIPLTGVPLPFLSYGGSSLVANWAAIGFLLTVLQRKERSSGIVVGG